MRRLVAAPDEIEAILRNGAERAAVQAEATMKQVREIVGFIR
jgi:tryptophanyl-tRNA synthetase